MFGRSDDGIRFDGLVFAVVPLSIIFDQFDTRIAKGAGGEKYAFWDHISIELILKLCLRFSNLEHHIQLQPNACPLLKQHTHFWYLFDFEKSF